MDDPVFKVSDRVLWKGRPGIVEAVFAEDDSYIVRLDNREGIRLLSVSLRDLRALGEVH